MPIEIEGFGNNLQQSDRESDCCLSLICLAALDDRKFIAAKSGQNVRFTQRKTQPARQFLEQLIASGVAKRIVDMFEPIEVQQKDCESLLPPPKPRQGLFQFFVQECSVADARQGIMAGHIRNLLFGQFSCRDIDADGRIATGFPSEPSCGIMVVSSQYSEPSFALLRPRRARLGR